MAANDKQLRALRDRKRAGNDRAERIAKIEEEIRKREEEKAADMFEQQRIKARDALRAEIAAIAVAGAEKILETSVDADKHGDMLNKLVAEL